MLCVFKLAVGYLIELYIIIIYNLKQRYLFDFQRDKIFNVGKFVFLIMLPVMFVMFVKQKLNKLNNINT